MLAWMLVGPPSNTLDTESKRDGIIFEKKFGSIYFVRNFEKQSTLILIIIYEAAKGL